MVDERTGQVRFCDNITYQPSRLLARRKLRAIQHQVTKTIAVCRHVGEGTIAVITDKDLELNGAPDTGGGEITLLAY